MSSSIEDYLKAIYEIQEQTENLGQGIKSIDLARHLGISKPSVSLMLRKLVSKGYIKNKPYSLIQLTRKGKEEGRRVLHNHRVIEVFLNKILCYDPEEVHDEAHRLEHAFSEQSIERLEAFLKNPQRSPLGKEIPHSKEASCSQRSHEKKPADN